MTKFLEYHIETILMKSRDAHTQEMNKQLEHINTKTCRR